MDEFNQVRRPQAKLLSPLPGTYINRVIEQGGLVHKHRIGLLHPYGSAAYAYVAGEGK